MLLLAIRMPAHVHDRHAERLKQGIRGQILKISDSNSSNAELAKAIETDTSASITLLDGTLRYPDAQFRTRKSLYPSVIIEVSNSQSEKNLAYLADQYIVETIGRVQVVIGVKLDYGTSLKAVLSLWRPQIVEESG